MPNARLNARERLLRVVLAVERQLDQARRGTGGREAVGRDRQPAAAQIRAEGLAGQDSEQPRKVVQREIRTRGDVGEGQGLEQVLLNEVDAAQKALSNVHGRRLHAAPGRVLIVLAGAAIWRAFAQHAESEPARIAFLGCADLEEESAAYLEPHLKGRR
jgi:hypothetical protein